MNKKMKTQRIAPCVSKYYMISAVYIILICLLLASCYVSNYTSSSLNDYSRCIGRTHPWNCALFPNRELITDDNCQFYDRFQFDGSNTPAYLTYALCTFDEDVFNNEKIRLTKQATIMSEEYFEKPAYILCLNDLGFSEYALLDEVQHTIHYVCVSSNQFLDKLPQNDRIKNEYLNCTVQYARDK